MDIRKLGDLSFIEENSFSEASQKKELGYLDKLTRLFVIEENFSEKKSIARTKIVKLLGSANGKVISKKAFESLKKTFCSHSNGYVWLEDLKQAVAERNREIDSAGFYRIACHKISGSLGKSITNQAELLISEMNQEMPRMIKNSHLPDFEPKLSLKQQEVNQDQQIEHDRESKENHEEEENSSVCEKTNERITECEFQELKIENENGPPEIDQEIGVEEEPEVAQVDEEPKVQELQKRVILDYGNYFGELKNNVPHGSGRLEHSNGDVYEGVFRDGDFIEGRSLTSFGATLEGEFRNYMLKGSGTITTVHGNVLSGQFIYGNLDFKTLKN